MNTQLNAALTSILLLAGSLTPSLASGVLFPPDNWPNEDWTVSNSGSALVEPTSLQGETWLRIARTADNSGSAQVTYTGVDNQLADFTGSVILGSGNNTNIYGFGVILRSRGQTFTQPDAYYLAITDAGLGLYWGAENNFLSTLNPLATDPLSAALGDLNSSNDSQYLLEFSFIANTLKASLSVWDSVDNKKGTELASLTYTDTRPEARMVGYFAIRGGRYGGTVNSYFRDVQVTAVPESASAARGLLPTDGRLLSRYFRRNN